MTLQTMSFPFWSISRPRLCSKTTLLLDLSLNLGTARFLYIYNKWVAIKTLCLARSYHFKLFYIRLTEVTNPSFHIYFFPLRSPLSYRIQPYLTFHLLRLSVVCIAGATLCPTTPQMVLLSWKLKVFLNQRRTRRNSRHNPHRLCTSLLDINF